MSNYLLCTQEVTFIFSPIFMKFHQNACLDAFAYKFEYSLVEENMRAFAMKFERRLMVKFFQINFT